MQQTRVIIVKSREFRLLSLLSFSLLGLCAGLMWGVFWMHRQTPFVSEETQAPTPQTEPQPSYSLSLSLSFSPVFYLSPPPAPKKPVPLLFPGEPLPKGFGETAEAQIWSGVAASPTQPGALALWAERRVMLSRDDGRSFQEVPVAEGEVIRGVALGEKGELYVLGHTGRLLILHPDGQGELRELSFVGETYSFLRSGDWMVWLGRSTDEAHKEAPEILAASKDAGKTWTFQKIGDVWGNFDNEIHLARDGSIQIMAAWEAGCGGGYQNRFWGHVDGRAWKELFWSHDIPVGFLVGPQRWSYWTRDDYYSKKGDPTMQLWAIGPDKKERQILTARIDDGMDPERIATNHKKVVLQWGGQLISLRKHKAKKLSEEVPEGFSLASVDSRDRAVGLIKGHVVRWSSRDGWRRIPTPSAPAREEKSAL